MWDMTFGIHAEQIWALPVECRPPPVSERVKGQLGRSLLAEDGVPCTKTAQACGGVVCQPNTTCLPRLPPPLTTCRAPSGAPLLTHMWLPHVGP